jgi:hypothetical protein
MTKWRQAKGRVTRRSLLAAAVLGAAFSEQRGVRADEPPQNNQPKISQDDAQYQPMPKGMFSCATCTFFIKPHACKVVAGDISPMGWCKLFDLPD